MSTPTHSLWHRPHKKPGTRRQWRRLISGSYEQCSDEMFRLIQEEQWHGEWYEGPVGVDPNKPVAYIHADDATT